MGVGRRTAIALVLVVVVVALVTACAGRSSSGRSPATEATTTTDAAQGARSQLDDIDAQLSQVADDSKAAQAGLDSNENDMGTDEGTTTP